MEWKAGTDFQRSENLDAPKKNQFLKIETDSYIWFCFVIAFPGIKVGKQ